MKYETVNPATGERIRAHETQSGAEVLDIVSACADAQRLWWELPIEERLPYFTRLASVLRENKDRFGGLITLEMGKPISEAVGEVEKCAWLCEVYAENGLDWLEEELVQADGLEHRVVFQPLGVILSVMPWNFPFWQALRFGVPGLMAGNGSVLKHASNVPQCSMAIEEAFALAGFPKNLFRSVLAGHDTVSEMIASDKIAGVSLTGSTNAGEAIAALAGKHLKKVVLELGGSDPFIVLEDADLDFAVEGAVRGRMICAGQSCIAAKRFIVHEAIADEFTQRFAERMAALRVGDPMLPTTQVGPVVHEKALKELLAQIVEARDLGGKILCGGSRLEGPGSFLEPTVISGTRPQMRVVSEETFGPVAPVIVVENDEEAVSVANDTEFGLGGSVWTRDLARGQSLARKLEVGTVFVNSIVKSDPRMPFGGVKKSGLGRELSHYGLKEFVNVKGINIYSHGIA